MSDRLREKVLIVDDDHSSRRSLSLVLDRADLIPLEASNGAQALSMVGGGEAPALALLDIKLPDMSGIEVLIKLKQLDPDLSVVMVTAHASVETAVVALNKGAAAFIVKPVDLEDMLATIDQLLERRRLVLENRRLYQEVQKELEERRRAEKERDLLVEAVESAGESIVVTDAAGKILYVNPAFERISEYSAMEVTGQTLDILAMGSRDEELHRQIDETLKRRGDWRGLMISYKKGGDEYREECTITPVTDPSGVISHYVHVRRDVTEKHKLESIAQAVNTMNNIGYVFSGIRHELGNPINSTIMTLKMLKARVEAVGKDEVETYIERVLEELSRVSFLLHSLRSFNMYESLEPTRLELSPFLEQFLVLVKGDCDKRGVALGATVEPEGIGVRADPRALQQVLLNVFTNALDACAGSVEAPPAVEIAARRERGGVCIRITDNGVGMSEEERENLFRPFVTGKPHGTGLGLVIGRKMMLEMDGSIDIESDKGSGTSVRLMLREWRDE